MGKQNALIRCILISFSILLLSGCGSESTANNVVDALKNEDYDEATQIFDDAVYSSDEPYEIHEATSIAIRDYLHDIYGEAYDSIDTGNYSKEESFYYLLNHIEEIGIDDSELDDAIDEYRGLLLGSYDDEDTYSEDDSYSDEEESFEDDESYDEEEYSEDDEYYEEEVSSDNPYTATNIDHDCPDFETQEDAQLFFEANGGPESDPHDLDRDNDGMACDWNP